MSNYGWNEARADLEEGISPKVVAAKLGEPEAYLLEVAEQQGWPITGTKNDVGVLLQ